MLTKIQHSMLVEGIEQLALEHVMYHVEKDRQIFDYTPAIVNYHKCLVKGNVTETLNYDHFIYSFDTLLAEKVDPSLFKNKDIKVMKKAESISISISDRVVNGYIFKPNHIYESFGELKIDWSKFNLKSHMRFLKESISHEVIAICDFKAMNGFYDGSHHLIKENKSLLKESGALGCDKKDYAYAKNVFEKTSKELYAILEENGFIVENVYNAGSLRRKKSTIGDVDLIVNVLGHKNAGKINNNTLDEKRFAESYQFLFGNTLKRNVSSEKVVAYKNIVQFIKEGMQCDVFLCTPTSLPTRRCYWTGSAAHNVSMMYEGFKKDILFSFDYIYDKNRGKFLVPRNEKQVFSALGVDYVKPEDRK